MNWLSSMGPTTVMCNIGSIMIPFPIYQKLMERTYITGSKVTANDINNQILNVTYERYYNQCLSLTRDLVNMHKNKNISKEQLDKLIKTLGSGTYHKTIFAKSLKKYMDIHEIPANIYILCEKLDKLFLSF